MTKRFSKVLVTGGAGFIGSHIVDRLVADGVETTVIDDMSSGKMENLAKCTGKRNFHFVKGDIRDWIFLKNVVKDVDAVFHEAALVSVARSIKEPLLTNEINDAGTLNVLKAASDCGVKRVVFASSASVYGNTECRRVDENVSVNPMSPYAVSKLAGEFYAKYFYSVRDLETVSLRCFNAYGPRQSLDPRSSYSGVISIFINRLFLNSSPRIFGDGEQTRDFVFVEDIVEANMLALNSKNAPGQVFNVGSGKSVSINQVAETLKQVLCRTSLENKYADMQPGDIRYSCADIGKARKMLRFEPRFSFDEGIRELVKWYTEIRS
jgi:nucleoside-diphosphate-sugar epimerase